MAERYVEISFGALIRTWPRLRRWLDEDRAGLLLHRRITEAAEEWAHANREESFLFRGATLVQTQEWRERHESDLNLLEREYLDASLGLKQRLERAAQERQLRELEAAQKLAAAEREGPEEEIRLRKQQLEDYERSIRDYEEVLRQQHQLLARRKDLEAQVEAMNVQLERVMGVNLFSRRTDPIMMRTKIFLASSSELEEDRKEFEILISRKNKAWLGRRAFLEVVMWEDFLDALSRTRLQDEYNKAIRECDVFVMLFCTKVGKYTQEEFETAFGQFKSTNKPLIYTYFKDAEISTGSVNKEDLRTLWAFQEKLGTLGHFYTVYKNVDKLKLHFDQQLDRLDQDGFIQLIDEPQTGDPGA